MLNVFWLVIASRDYSRTRSIKQDHLLQVSDVQVIGPRHDFGNRKTVKMHSREKQDLTDTPQTQRPEGLVEKSGIVQMLRKMLSNCRNLAGRSIRAGKPISFEYVVESSPINRQCVCAGTRRRSVFFIISVHTIIRKFALTVRRKWSPLFDSF